MTASNRPPGRAADTLTDYMRETRMTMNSTESPSPAGNVTQEQMGIYARELRDFFFRERHLQEQLQAQQEELKNREREVTALNRMMQEHLMDWYQLAQGYRQVLAQVKKVLEEPDGQVDAGQAKQLRRVLERAGNNQTDEAW